MEGTAKSVSGLPETNIWTKTIFVLIVADNSVINRNKIRHQPLGMVAFFKYFFC